MWVCKNNSFVSIVEDWNDPHYVLVRGRREEDVAQFITSYQGIEETPDADYRFRIRITKLDLVGCLLVAANEIEYSNFKNSVEDPALKQFYHEVWNSGVRNLDPDRYEGIR